ncbi:hypothetical protein BGZ94_007781 [Podila epigama]|nr:hypothetical protein BGZ94_007781 [Podila epigama]
MQQGLFSSVRSNLYSLPRSISPHIGSPPPPSIRSLSPSRSPHVRSRSSSPSPRRFASVLAYHATPPPEGRSHSEASENRQELHEPHEPHNHDMKKDDGNTGSDVSKEIKETVSIENTSTSIPSDAATSPLRHLHLHHHHSRPLSPLSKMSKKPYRELIECNSLKNPDVSDNQAPVSNVSAQMQKAKSSNTHDEPKSEAKNTFNINVEKKNEPKFTRDDLLGSNEATEEKRSASSGQHHKVGSTFLASDEVRHILNLPPLLGQDPSTILQALGPVDLGEPASGHSLAQPAPRRSQFITNLDAKAEETAEAMTKRYSAKNLNMTETEAHRMVQVMAAEIVVLHEERQQMLERLEQAQQEMLEAARLLRLRAAEEEEIEEKPTDRRSRSHAKDTSGQNTS